MINDFRIIIPTYNRPHFLDRMIEYYKHYDYEQNIIIADGSKSPWEGRNKTKAKYYHMSETPFIQRVNKIIEEIDVSYICFGSDDDFIFPSSIERIFNFLKHNDDYSAGHGYYLFSYVSNNKISYGLHYENKYFDNVDDDVVQRILHTFTKHFQQNYSLIKKEIWINYLNIFAVAGVSEELIYPINEQLLHFLSTIAGKIKVFNHVHSVRDYYSPKTPRKESLLELATAWSYYYKVLLTILKQLKITAPNVHQLLTERLEYWLENQTKHFFKVRDEIKHPDYWAAKGIQKPSIRKALDYEDFQIFVPNNIKPAVFEPKTFSDISYIDSLIRKYFDNYFIR